ncbi:MAG: molybdenum cofactor guanylyltransferase [Gemmatimonadales bacterium]
MRCAILAGGYATRFDGRPKGLERVGGERILDRVIQAVQLATGSRPILIANAPDAGGWADLEIVPDAIPDCGSLGGIYTAVTSGEGPVAVVAWDMPFLSSDLITALIEEAAGRDAVLPASRGPLGMEPLCAVYDQGSADHIRRSLEAEDYRTTGFHGEARVGILALERVSAFGNPETLFFNVNTRDDLDRAQQLWQELHQGT